jgi:hypothetical protein
MKMPSFQFTELGLRIACNYTFGVNQGADASEDSAPPGPAARAGQTASVLRVFPGSAASRSLDGSKGKAELGEAAVVAALLAVVRR